MSGQTLVTGADTAMVIALSAAMGGFKPVTTVDLTINYIRPVTKADAIITAKVMRLGRSLAFLTTEITEAGSIKPSAFATGTYAIPAQ
ncbi:MAG: PaaI family thioesterase, partial [Hyphomicrobiaceae bacterium]|nr:PaaI family thioesterase [Hyphomicrobiaceae bacterium]